jgi:hypothetical protein
MVLGEVAQLAHASIKLSVVRETNLFSKAQTN